MDQQTSLEVSRVSKAFGPVQALQDVDFVLRAGEVHALAGENGAGKSTLMNIIDGILSPDSGEIRIRGQLAEIRSPEQAQALGIGFVHQEIALCGDMTVAENIFMATTNRRRSFWMNYGEIREKAREVLSSLGDIAPDRLVGDLTISQQQIVEIAKALTLDCTILILDEPTARLKQRGISIIYISHRMAEIFDNCDRITVLRDGRHVSTDDIADMTPEKVVARMVGRSLGSLYPEKNKASGKAPTLLSVEGLSDDNRFKDVSFELRKGEVLGIAGLIGSGRTEIALAICGLMKRLRGTVRLGGRDISPATYQDSVANGVVYLSEDRKGSGVFLDMPIAANVSALDPDRISTRYGFISRTSERRQAEMLGDALRLRRSSVDDNVSTLSGGNQQKVAIAKMLSVNPKVILLDEPTRGVDVGAKVEIHRILRDLANQGTGIVAISSELPELIGVCDRVIVVHEGRIAGEVSAEELTEETLIRLASGLGNAERRGK
jgi:ribose transport system ATP-binding protein